MLIGFLHFIFFIYSCMRQVLDVVIKELLKMCTVTQYHNCTVVKVIGKGIAFFMSSLLQVSVNFTKYKLFYHSNHCNVLQEAFGSHELLLTAKAANDISFAIVVAEDLEPKAQFMLFDAIFESSHAMDPALFGPSWHAINV